MRTCSGHWTYLRYSLLSRTLPRPAPRPACGYSHVRAHPRTHAPDPDAHRRGSVHACRWRRPGDRPEDLTQQHRTDHLLTAWESSICYHHIAGGSKGPRPPRTVAHQGEDTEAEQS